MREMARRGLHTSSLGLRWVRYHIGDLARRHQGRREVLTAFICIHEVYLKISCLNYLKDKEKDI